MRTIILLIISLAATQSYSQQSFQPDTSRITVVTSDINNFWKAFDQLETVKKPFKKYLDEGSAGLKDFIPYRIESSKNLLKTVKSMKNNYEAVRIDYNYNPVKVDITEIYQTFENLYPEAKLPTIYFVIGAFNTTGAAVKNGIVIGVETLGGDISSLSYIIAHELIHFNQNYAIGPIGKSTLLEQSIKEGSADFLSSLITGAKVNDSENYQYGNNNEDELRKEYIKIMNGTAFKGWLYGQVKKEGRPANLGYWIGYKICEAYYAQSSNKKVAINEILNIKDFSEFVKTSGYFKENKK